MIPADAAAIFAVVSDPVDVIPLAGFDPDGEPEIRRMADGSLSVVFNFMPPSWSEERAGASHFRTEITSLVANVRSSPAVAGATITLPGDPERQQRERRSREGVTLDDGTWGQIRELAGRLGVAVP